MSNETNYHQDFELVEFLNRLQNDINISVSTDEEGASKEQKFTEYLFEILDEAEETEAPIICSYIRENRLEQILHKINGYAFTEEYETLDIFVTNYHDTNNVYRLGKNEFEKLLRWPTKFVHSILKDAQPLLEQSANVYTFVKQVNRIKKSIVRVNIFILSNFLIPHEPPKDFKFTDLTDLIINYHVWDLERIQRLVSSTNSREPIEIDIEKTMGQVIPCMELSSKNDVYDCYLAIVPGKVLSTLYKNYGMRLLESNVRAFLQQRGSVNKGIRDTILKEPHMFLTYNNGLSATARDVTLKKDKNGNKIITAIKDFQIVNGGQTTASLFHTEKQHKASLINIFIQMKLTVIKHLETKDNVISQISRFANTQNKVSEVDLTSNAPFLQKLEELSRRIFATSPTDKSSQSHWFFERTKGQYNESLNREPSRSKKDAFEIKFPKNQVIIKSDMAKFMNIKALKPNIVSRGAQKNYQYYVKNVLYNDDNFLPDRIFFEDLVASAILFQETDKLFGKKNQNPIGDTNLKSFTVAYALSYLQFLNPKFNYYKIWLEQCIPDDLKKELKQLLQFVYVHLVSSENSLVSEYAKKEECWNLLKDKSDHLANMDVIFWYSYTDSDFKARYESISTNEILEVNQNHIVNYGSDFWQGLAIWGELNESLEQTECSICKKISNKIVSGLSLNEKTITQGIFILNKVEEDGIEHADITKIGIRESLSNHE